MKSLPSTATDAQKIEWVKSRLSEEGLSFVEAPAPTMISIPSLEIDGELSLDRWISFVMGKLGNDRAKGFYFCDSTDASDAGQAYVYDPSVTHTLSLILWGEGQALNQFAWKDAFIWSYCAWADGWDYGTDHCGSARISFLLRELNYRIVDLPAPPVTPAQ